MKVQCHAWVNFEDDNTTQIVNIEDVTTFDVVVETYFRCVCVRNVILHYFRYKEVRYYVLNYVLDYLNAVEST